MEKIQIINAPKAVGPYSQGVILPSDKKLLFVSGQLPFDLMTGKLIEGGIDKLTHQVIDHIEAILVAGGSSLDQVIRVEVFLTDLANFKVMNEEYSKRFKGDPLPARQTIQVAGLPMGSPIEISCIAYVS